MKQLRLDPAQKGVVVVSHKLRQSGELLRRLYHAVVKGMEDINLPPTRVGTKVLGMPSGYASYKARRRRVEALDFDQIKYIEVEHLKPERLTGHGADFFNWSAYGSVGVEDTLHPELGLLRMHLTIYHEDADIPEATALNHALAVARNVIKTYGYITLLTRNYLMFPGFSGPEGRGMWLDCNFAAHAHMSILRDVYPYNFLSRSYLDIPIEGTTLERWIMRSDERGSLRPFNDHVVLWEPPPANIPKLREELYRAGHLLYYYFFDPSSRHYRDWSKPFVPSEPIPDVFRAETYIGSGPRVMA